MRDFHVYYHVVIWLLPWASVIALLVLHYTGYVFASFCSSKFDISIDAVLWIPLAVVIFPATILNMVVLVKIALVARSRNASMQKILKLQQRSFLFVMTVLFMFLVYWVRLVSLASFLSYIFLFVCLLTPLFSPCLA